MSKMTAIYRLLFAASILAIGFAAKAQISTFDSVDDGWTVTSFANPNANDFSIVSSSSVVYNASGGNGGGYISKTDPDTGDFYFIAPNAFLGNKAGATTLSYDLIYAGTPDYQTHDVILVGTAKKLIYRANPNIVPGPNWSSFTVTLSPASTWLNGIGGPAATATDFAEVLGNLQGLYIKGEYTSGVVETTGLDNVRLEPVPEPASIAVIGFGLAMLVRRKLRS
jgi:Laminin B (Domain IV)/PEP-CTERM motif